MTALSPSGMSQADSPRQLGSLADRVFRAGMGLGVGAIVLSVLIALVTGMELGRFFKSYLLGFVFVLTIALGALFFVLIQHVTRAGWSVTVRRVPEALAANLNWLWIAFLPLIGLALTGYGKYLYSWMDPAKRVVEVDPLYAHKAGYLNEGFWSFRAVLFLAVWAVLATFYFKRSVAQDSDGDKKHSFAMMKFAPIGILLFALTITFAAFDWMMALEAHWFSTMFGVYFFAMSACAFFATLPILFHLLQRSGRLENDVTLEHYQDLGKLLFGFGIVFHAYIAFSQFMLLWYANIPEATSWWLARTSGPWLPLMYLLPVGHFAIPFLLLVTKHTKRIPKVLAGICVWMLVMHLLDLYLVIMPEIPVYELPSIQDYPQWTAMVRDNELSLGFAPHIIDLILPIGFAGLLIAMTARRLRNVSLIPARDPRLPEAQHFENM